MEMYFKILLLTKCYFDLPGTGNCIDTMEHFENLMMIRLKYSIKILYMKKIVAKMFRSYHFSFFK